jgi:hypothetical protein
MGGINPSEVRGLEGGDNAIQHENECSYDGVPDTLVFTQPEPDEIPAANLAQSNAEEI